MVLWFVVFDRCWSLLMCFVGDVCYLLLCVLGRCLLFVVVCCLLLFADVCCPVCWRCWTSVLCFGCVLLFGSVCCLSLIVVVDCRRCPSLFVGCWSVSVVEVVAVCCQ